MAGMQILGRVKCQGKEGTTWKHGVKKQKEHQDW